MDAPQGRLCDYCSSLLEQFSSEGRVGFPNEGLIAYSR